MLNVFDEVLFDCIIKNCTKQMAEYLTKHGTNLNLQDSNGSTPLIRAIREGNLEHIQYLLKKGADITLQDNEKHTAFMRAVTSGDKDIIQAAEEIFGN